MDELMDQIADSIADYAVQRYGRHLSKNRQLVLWARYREAAIAALLAYEGLAAARRIRVKAYISEN